MEQRSDGQTSHGSGSLQHLSKSHLRALGENRAGQISSVETVLFCHQVNFELDLDGGPAEYFEMDEKPSPQSSPEIVYCEESSSESDTCIIELSSDSEEEDTTFDDIQSSNSFSPVLRNEPRERVLIHIREPVKNVLADFVR